MGNKKKGIIISALGKKSFSKEQIAKIDSVLDATFYAQLTPMSKEEFIHLVKPAEILAVTRRCIKDIDKDIIQSLPKLKGIAIYSTGYEWIDVDCLIKKGIILSYLPDYSTISVAEHTLATMLVMSRRIHLSFDKARGFISDDISLRGWELKGKILGIIGFGKIGQEVARLAKSFGMRVYFYDNKRVNIADKNYLPFEEVLKIADVIAITASKKRNISFIIGKRELSLLKKGAYLINTSRADLVDNNAIIDAIKGKKLAGYVVDDNIDIFTKDSTIEPGRILQTAHTAWYSNEALARGTEEWVNNIVALAINKPKNVVKG